jgi:hypothetical protein
MRRLLAVALVLFCSTPGCSDRESRPVTGGYCLDRMFDGDHYNLTPCGVAGGLRGKTDNGPLDGTVHRIGWDDRYVVAFRQPLVRSEGDGWMILDTAAHALRGPLSDAQWARERERDPTLRHIVVHPVGDAWKLLGTS